MVACGVHLAGLCVSGWNPVVLVVPRMSEVYVLQDARLDAVSRNLSPQKYSSIAAGLEVVSLPPQGSGRAVLSPLRVRDCAPEIGGVVQVAEASETNQIE